MKTRVNLIWGLGLAVGALALINLNAQEASGQPTNSSPPIAQEAHSNFTPVIVAQSHAPDGQDADADVSDAAFQPISTEKPLPAKVKPTGPVAEVIRLAESGIEEGVILAYVTNSTSTFNLNPDGIIYLNDIGLPGSVVTAMIQRDQVLKGVPANPSAAGAPAQAVITQPYAPTPEMSGPEVAQDSTPPPEQMPPPDYGPTDVAPAEDGSYSTFYDSLAPYGTWVDVAGYGPCWQPTVVVANPYWQPYFNGGHWVYTDCGWYWMSGYSWGWAPFHYGRWFRHQNLGWCWAPDTTWGPSWVTWRYGAAHAAWAPLPPGAWYRRGVGLTFHGKHVDSTFGFGLGTRAFAVVPFTHFYDHHVSRYGVPQHQASEVLKGTLASTYIGGSNNRVINDGLPRSRVIAATGTHIHSLAVHDAQPAGRGGRAEKLEPNGTSLSVFRPSFSPNSGTQPASAAWVNRNAGGSATYYPPGGSALPPSDSSRTPVAEIRGTPTQPFGSVNNRMGAKDTIPRGALVITGNGQTTVRQPAAQAWSAPQGVAAEQHVPGSAYRPPEVQWTAPSYSRPQQTYSPPAPAYNPPPQVRSAPEPAVAPRPEVVQSRPAYSPPPAPAPSAPAPQAPSSSGKWGR